MGGPGPHPSVPSPCHGSITGQSPAPPAPAALMEELLFSWVHILTRKREMGKKKHHLENQSMEDGFWNACMATGPVSHTRNLSAECFSLERENCSIGHVSVHH